MNPQTQHVVEMVKTVADKQGIPIEDAFNRVITWIAVQIEVEHQLPTDALNLDAYNALCSLFDLELLKSEKGDWFGEAAEHLGILTALPGQQETNLKVSLVVDPKDFPESFMPKTILVENVYSGRDYFALHEVTQGNALLFGVEPHQLLYRIAVLNTKMHELSAFTLNAEPSVLDRSLGSENWRYANLWSPIKKGKLRNE